jgi:signal transduction histidine kinase
LAQLTAQVQELARSRGLLIEVRDDGRGFDQHAVEPGLGFSSISARVDRIGGHSSVSSAAGKGTRVSVVLPCSVEQAR